MRTITARIQRFDGKSEHWVQEYKIPYEKGMTILNILTKIKEEFDQSLTYTAACRAAICGSCGVRINGQAFLACKTPLDDVLNTLQTDDLFFEPLASFDVVRDLVIDWEPKFEKMKKVQPWLNPSSAGSHEEGFVQSDRDFHKINASSDCILCGLCASSCSILNNDNGESNFLDPFILNKAFKFAVDSRSANPEEHLRAVFENDLWKCVHCMECVSKCPKEINLAEEIASLRRMTMEMGETRNSGARHAYAFYNDIKNKGRLNEATLPMKTEGVFTTVKKRVPLAMRMMAKGKINPLEMPKEIEGIEDVRKIYAYVKAGVEE
jgi:succinate dehydrogenase / fumarate reductase iron-sulfur subunit